MGTLIFLFLAYIALHVGLYRLFERAGIAGWKALIPIYSEAIWCDVLGRPRWWSVLLWVPILGLFVGAGMLIDLARAFGRHGLGQHFLVVVFPFVYLPYLAWRTEAAYQGPSWRRHRDWRRAYKAAQIAQNALEISRLEREMPYPKKSVAREWTESIVFAVFAAHFIRLFLIEAYTIPTPSMEGSLLVGDFLFVSKVHYGSRLPMTPLSFPLLHNTLPIAGTECYTRALTWGYHRAPAIQAVERFDPVVFNFPEDDTVFGGLDVSFENQYHNLVKTGQKTRAEILQNPVLSKKIITRPVDKRSFYIKRCVGLPGDKIEVRNGLLYVNDQETGAKGKIQYRHHVHYNRQLSKDELREIERKYDLSFVRNQNGQVIPQFVDMTIELAKQLQTEYPQIDSIERQIQGAGQADRGIFPYNVRKFPWNNDQYGPIEVPKKGQEVRLNLDNIDLYARIISAYEGHELKLDNGQIFIDGKPADSYTFEMDYFWMMGDNRHNSADSRSWGFVPEDHVVGKPLFVWMSLRNASLGEGVRWHRVFKSATGD